MAKTVRLTQPISVAPRTRTVISRHRVRTIAPAMTDGSRRYGDTSRLTDRQMEWNGRVLQGENPVSAAAAVGYASPASSAYQNLHHTGLIEINKALFARLGISESDIAQRIIDGFDANKTIAVVVTKEDGQITGKTTVTEPDHQSRVKYVKLAADMTGMTPESKKIELSFNKTDVHVQGDVKITTGLEGLSGKELMDAFKERMAKYGNGELKAEDVYGVKPGDGPVAAMTRVFEVHSDIAEAAAHHPTVGGSKVSLDPVNGEVIEYVEHLDELPGDRLRASLSGTVTPSKVAVKRFMKRRYVRPREVDGPVNKPEPPLAGRRLSNSSRNTH